LRERNERCQAEHWQQEKTRSSHVPQTRAFRSFWEVGSDRMPWLSPAAICYPLCSEVGSVGGRAGRETARKRRGEVDAVQKKGTLRKAASPSLRVLTVAHKASERKLDCFALGVHRDLDVRAHLAVQLHRNVELAQLLQRLIQLDLAAIDRVALLLQRVRDVR
jgi:hypothetical protein